jgi:dTMP kinase
VEAANLASEDPINSSWSACYLAGSMRGKFITFEGLDGSGKSTHLKRAVAWLLEAGVDVCATREPGGTPIGRAIRRVFLDPQWGEVDGRVETLLIFASRRQHLCEVIEPALAEGKHVLCDRFTDSTLVYQGAGRGVDTSIIERVDELATGRRRPDRTLLFDLPPEVAQGRGQSLKRAAQPNGIDRLDSEDLAFYRRVRSGYLELAESEPDRFLRVDSSGELDHTQNQVRKALADLLASAP